MEFIREQQKHEELTGNKRSHVIFADDADLIFLGLGLNFFRFFFMFISIVIFVISL